MDVVFVRSKIRPQVASVPPVRGGTRRFGAMQDRIVVDDGFFEPLPEDELARWDS